MGARMYGWTRLELSQAKVNHLELVRALGLAHARHGEPERPLENLEAEQGKSALMAYSQCYVTCCCVLHALNARAV